MSKAFTSEEATVDVVVPPRAPLPPGVTNYVTPRGLELLRAERQALEAARAELENAPEEGRGAALTAWATRLGELDQRIASASVVDPSTVPAGVARFGSTVTVADEDGNEKTFEIVGVDEADPASGKIASWRRSPRRSSDAKRATASTCRRRANDSVWRSSASSERAPSRAATHRTRANEGQAPWIAMPEIVEPSASAPEKLKKRWPVKRPTSSRQMRRPSEHRSGA